MTIRIACIGDSLTNGSTGTGDPWPLQLREKLSNQYDPHNWGYGSTGTSIALNPLWRKQASQQAYDIVVVWTGLNDLGTLTADQIYANLSTLYREIKESGAKVIACAISPFGDAPTWSAEKQTALEAVNTAIATGDYVDVFLDLYEELEDTSTATYLLVAYDSGDNIHINDAGKDRVATLVAAAVEQVSNPFWIMANQWGLTTILHPSWIYGTDRNGTFAASLGNRCIDGGNCKGLLDFGSAEVDMTQTGANLWPIYRVGVRNGCAAAEFDGSDDYMAGGNKLAIAYNTAFSLWFVVKCASTGTQSIVSKHDGSAGYEIRYDGTNLTLEMTNTAASNSLIVAFPMDLHSDYALVELHSTGAGTAAGITCRRNRVVVAGTASVNNLSASIATASNVTIGARAGGASQWLDGFFGCLAYGAAMSPWAKWAVTFALAKQFGFLRLYSPTELPTAAQVESGVGFGYDDSQYVGTFAGGYTYGDEDPEQVLTTADGSTAASYVVPVQASVLCVADGGTAYGPASGIAGLATLPLAADVQSGAADYGISGALRDPAYQTTADTQADDAAILEAEKAYLLATKTITFGASSVVGTLAVANVLTAVTGGTYVVPVVGQVLAPAQGGTAYGAGGGTSGTLTFADTTYVLNSVPDYGIAGTGKTGTATLPATSVVLTAAWGGPATYGVAGTGSTPQATLTAADNVLFGSGTFGKFGALLTPNYYGPSSQAGVTTTTTYGVGNATSGLLDLSLYTLTATLVAAIDAAKADILSTRTLYTVTGTYVAITQADARLTGAGYYGAGGVVDGTCNVPDPRFVLLTVPVDATTGTFANVAEASVIEGASWGEGGTEFNGTYHEAATNEVKDLVTFGALEALTGTYSPGGTYDQGVVAGAGAQLILDQVDVAAVAGSILTTVTGLLGTVDGTYVAPVQAGYSALAAGYGAGGLTTGTLAAAKIHDATYGTLADGSVLVAAGGTYIDPADAEVKLGTAVGVTPRAGTWDAVTKTDVVAATWVVVGHDRWTGGAAGEYPTTATSQAAQLATDQAAVDAVKAGIRTTVTVLGVTGTLDLSLYTLISGVAAAADVRLDVPRYTGGPLGTLVVDASGTYPDPAYVHLDAGDYGPTGTEYTPELSLLSLWTVFASPAAATDCIPIRVAAAVATEISRASFAGELSKTFTAAFSFGSEITKLEDVNDSTLIVDVLPAMDQEWTHRAGSIYKHSVAIKVGIRRRIATTDRTEAGAVDTTDVTGYVNLLYEIINLLAASRSLPTLAETVWDSSKPPQIHLYDEQQLKQGLYLGWTHLPFIYHERAA